jgi:hypothetical protein
VRAPPAPARVFALIAAAACGAPPPAPPPPAPAATCVLADDGGTGDTVRIGLTESVDPTRAPAPGNDAEALVFRHLYEPLVDLDCEGAVRPALATAWHAEDGGRAWTFALRPDAAFWDGAPLDANAMLAGWKGTDAGSVVDGVRSDRRTITVLLTEDRPIEFFAQPALRVVKRIPESRWPVGTGPWWIGARAASDSLLVAGPVRREGAGPLAFMQVAGNDARDLVDAGAGLLVTRDPRAWGYVAGRDDWVSQPLAWDRTYGLASSALGDRPPAVFDASFLEALARDVVPGDGRAAPPADAAAACSSGAVAPGLRHRVVYQRGDPVARAMAERLVARADAELAQLLGGDRTRGGVTAVGLADADFDAARARGDDLAYVVATRGADPPRCAAPLVQTRAHALVRRGTGRVVRDRDGVRLDPESRSR